MPEDFRAVMEYVKRGTCPVNELISAIYTPSQAQEALDGWAAAPAKVFRILMKFDD
jgi:threonine dehydrogenase-like Zn-dependent dehydrogenase